MYRFDEIGATWFQLGQDMDGEAAGAYSGWTVAMSSDGSTVAIGAYSVSGLVCG